MNLHKKLKQACRHLTQARNLLAGGEFREARLEAVVALGTALDALSTSNGLQVIGLEPTTQTGLLVIDREIRALIKDTSYIIDRAIEAIDNDH